MHLPWGCSWGTRKEGKEKRKGMRETEGPNSKQPPFLGLATPSEFSPSFVFHPQSTGTFPGQVSRWPSGGSKRGDRR